MSGIFPLPDPADLYNLMILYFFNYFTVVQLQLSAYSPHPYTLPSPNPPPSPASTLPLGFVHVSFYSSS